VDLAIIFSGENFLRVINSVVRLSSRAIPGAAAFQFPVVCALKERE
jgi:hypothetical protein